MHWQFNGELQTGEKGGVPRLLWKDNLIFLESSFLSLAIVLIDCTRWLQCARKLHLKLRKKTHGLLCTILILKLGISGSKTILFVFGLLQKSSWQNRHIIIVPIIIMLH